MDGPVFSRNFAMGRMSIGLSSRDNINPYNPASMADITWTKFEAAVLSKNYWYQSGEQSQAGNKTHFNNLALGFPITKWWGASFGLLPLSHVGYDYQSSGMTDSEVSYNNIFRGSGGINRVFLSQGIKIKKLKVGMNLSYLFGLMEYEEVVDFGGNDNFLNTASVKSVETSDMYFDFGAQYSIDLTKKWNMNLGLIYVPQQGLASNESTFDFTYRNSSGLARIIDTVSISEEESFSIILPAKYGLGVLFNKSERLKIGLDMEFEQWSVSNYNTFEGLRDVLMIKVGGERTSKEKKYKIRLGARYSTMAININDQLLDEVAASVGMTIPFRSKDKLTFAELNVAAEFGQRGRDEDQMLLEKFINVQIGLTLSNKWFIKRKYD